MRAPAPAPLTPRHSKTDFDAALGADGLMVVDFFATWCGPCKIIAPQVASYAPLHLC